jgi:hypothetical protein
MMINNIVILINNSLVRVTTILNQQYINKNLINNISNDMIKRIDPGTTIDKHFHSYIYVYLPIYLIL